MFNWTNGKNFQLTNQEENLLTNLSLDREQPGTILHDFSVMLQYILENQPSVTQARQLPIKALVPLNERMKRPLRHILKRPLQKSFPHINGLYLILRASGLTYIDTTSKSSRLLIDQTVLQSWQSLNATEQYFTLLESWLLRGVDEILGESRGGFWGTRNPVFSWVDLFGRLSRSGNITFESSEEIDHLKYWPGYTHLALLDLFGFIEIRQGNPVAGQGWQIELVRATPIGQAMMKPIAARYYEGNLVNLLENPAQIHPGALQAALQIYFPNWKNNLQWPEPAYRKGTHIFQVFLGKEVWRRVAISDRDVLDSLCHLILKAFKFDDDHLYRFIYDTPLGISQDINHPYMDEGPFTSEVTIGDLPLRVGMSMLFNFDFGDNWYFEVKLEQVDENSKPKKPTILESFGEAPPQYRMWDEEW